MGVERKRCRECEHLVIRTTGDRVLNRVSICTYRGYDMLMYLTECPKELEQEQEDERTDSD